MIIKAMCDVVYRGVYTKTSGTRILDVIVMKKIINLKDPCKCLGVHNFDSKYCNNKK